MTTRPSQDNHGQFSGCTTPTTSGRPDDWSALPCPLANLSSQSFLSLPALVPSSDDPPNDSHRSLSVLQDMPLMAVEKHCFHSYPCVRLRSHTHQVTLPMSARVTQPCLIGGHTVTDGIQVAIIPRSEWRRACSLTCSFILQQRAEGSKISPSLDLDHLIYRCCSSTKTNRIQMARLATKDGSSAMEAHDICSLVVVSSTILARVFPLFKPFSHGARCGQYLSRRYSAAGYSLPSDYCREDITIPCWCSPRTTGPVLQPCVAGRSQRHREHWKL